MRAWEYWPRSGCVRASIRRRALGRKNRGPSVRTRLDGSLTFGGCRGARTLAFAERRFAWPAARHFAIAASEVAAIVHQFVEWPRENGRQLAVVLTEEGFDRLRIRRCRLGLRFARKALKGIEGKRLTYQRAGETGNAYAEDLYLHPLAPKESNQC